MGEREDWMNDGGCCGDCIYNIFQGSQSACAMYMALHKKEHCRFYKEEETAHQKGKVIDRALIIKKEHLTNIFDNGKVWEMRSSCTNIRGEIGLIEAGTGLIVGRCNLHACSDMSHLSSDVLHSLYYGNHLVKDADALKKWNKAWHIRGAERFDKPIPYLHPQGAVIWVKLLPFDI
jgi:hypothetical protein